MAAKKKTTEGMELIVTMLKRNPKTEYATIKAAADKKKVSVYPIMFGRAQAMLGIVKSAKRGEGKAKRAAAKAAKASKSRGRPAKSRSKVGRRVKSTGSSPLDAVHGLVSSMKETERENDQLRTTLEKIRSLIDQAV